MSSFFQRWFGRTEEHISDDILLALLDGELSVGNTRRANRHLESCWGCRARFEQVERTIVRIVGYRKHLAAPFLPPPPGGRDKFLAQLDQLIDEAKIPWGSTPFSVLSPTFVTKMNPILATVAVVVLATVMLLLIWVRGAPTVSASELLQRAEVWDRQPVAATQIGVVFQKVRIHTKKRTTERTLYRDVAGRRKPRLAAPRQVDAEVNEVLERAGIDLQQPLSAASFREWHDQLAEKTDEVKHTGPDNLMLVTDTDFTNIKESSLSVRKADFHPIARHVLMRDSEEIDIFELNYDVLSWDAINTVALFEEPAVAPVPPKPAATPPIVNPLETELAVRYALHEIGADLGEPIDIQTRAQGPASVSVVGIVPSAERKQQLLAVLQGIPHVAAQFQTEEEAAAQELHAPVTRVEPRIVTTHSPIDKELLESLGGPEAVQNFSNQAIAVTEDLMAHAWALRHLAERYSAPGSNGELELSPSSRRMLQAMEGDHRRAMRGQLSELTTLLRPVLQSMVEEAALESPPESTAALSPFSGAEKVQHLALELLSGAGSPDPTGQILPAKSAQELLAALRGLENSLEDQP